MRLFRQILTVSCLVQTAFLFAQNAGAPLTIQGIDQFSISGARARGMGGSVFGVGEDANSLFSNPSLLTKVKSLNVQLGSSLNFSSYKQEQEWHPDEYYAELSLVIEGTIRNVVDTIPQKLARPYDQIPTDWNEDKNRTTLPSVAVSFPFSFLNTKWNVSGGFREVISLDTYFQNNNVLDPNIGAYRPSPVVRPKVGDSVKVQWYQFIRERTGSINGYSIGGAVDILENLTIGLSGTMYNGTSDDLQRRVGRGIFVLKTNNSSGFNVMRNDSLYYHNTITGTSEYSGMNGSISGAFHNEVFTMSAVVVTPLEIKREWSSKQQIDSMSGSFSTITQKGNDKISIPIQYSFGIALHPSSKVSIGIDYVVNSYNETKYSNNDTTINPWLTSALLRSGIEYRPSDWLALRAGYRENVQTFIAAGAALFDDPVRGSVYTVGCGFRYNGITADIAYEYMLTEYSDAWESNINYNTFQTHSISVDLGYQF